MPVASPPPRPSLQTWLAAASLTVGVVAACSEAVKPPPGPGVCWRMLEAPGQPPSFQPLARDIANLENCAVQLEGARMMEGRPVAGAYGGRFIFATEADIASAASLKGPRVQVFQPAHRAEIQKGLRKLIELRRAEGKAG